MRFSYDIASDFHEARVAQEEILAAVTAAGYGDNDMFAIKLSLEEAVINAIKHGNKLDAQKRVKIDATVSPDHVEVVIVDQGRGFDRVNVPDPTLEENLEKNCGRGILLIEAYMSSVAWSDNGRRLHMIKHREPAMAPKV